MGTTKRIFGSGKVRIGSVGAALTDAANGVGDVQSVGLDVAFDKKELMNSPELSMFPVAVAYHGGKVEIKVKFQNFNRDVMKRISGATETAAAGVTTLTITKTSKPAAFKFEYEGVDTDGAPVKMTLLNAQAPGLALALALDDFGSSDITISGYPDAATGEVLQLATNT